MDDQITALHAEIQRHIATKSIRDESSWMVEMFRSIMRKDSFMYQNFVSFHGCEPRLFSHPSHTCHAPLDISTNASSTNFKQVVMQQKFYEYVKQCKRAQRESCSNFEKTAFVKDTAFRQRRYCTKAVIFEILKRADVNGLKFDDTKKYAPQVKDNVDQFENNRYTLPKGYQCFICTEKEQYCQQNRTILTVRVQQNAFQCQVHFGYGTKQARQLALLAKKDLQRTSCYLLTDGYYCSVVEIDWESCCERRETFNSETELDALIDYAARKVREQCATESALQNKNLPDSIKLLQVKSGKVAIVQYEKTRFALKFHSDNKEQHLIGLLNSFEKCDQIIQQQYYPGNVSSMSVSIYAGKSLFEHCFCDSEITNEIANTVRDEIDKALAYLHRHNYVFVDLHPGNIVYQKETGAKLVDIESLSKIDTDGEEIRLVPYFKGPNYRSHRLRAEDDYISLRLVIFYILNTERFRDVFLSEAFSEKFELDLKIRLLNEK